MARVRLSHMHERGDDVLDMHLPEAEIRLFSRFFGLVQKAGISAKISARQVFGGNTNMVKFSRQT